MAKYQQIFVLNKQLESRQKNVHIIRVQDRENLHNAEVPFMKHTKLEGRKAQHSQKDVKR